MNVQQMIDYVRFCVHEPRAAAISNAEIVGLLNLAQDHVANVVRNQDEKFFVVSAPITATIGNTSLTMPTDALAGGWIRLEKPAVNGVIGTEVQIVDVNDTRLRQIFSVGSLVAAYPEGNNLVLTQTPTAADVYTLHYEKRLTQMIGDTEVGLAASSEIPVEHHEMLPLWAAVRFYQRADDDPGEWQRAYDKKEFALMQMLDRRTKQRPRRVKRSPDLYDVYESL